MLQHTPPSNSSQLQNVRVVFALYHKCNIFCVSDLETGQIEVHSGCKWSAISGAISGCLPFFVNSPMSETERCPYSRFISWESEKKRIFPLCVKWGLRLDNWNLWRSDWVQWNHVAVKYKNLNLWFHLSTLCLIMSRNGTAQLTATIKHNSLFVNYFCHCRNESIKLRHTW